MILLLILIILVTNNRFVPIVRQTIVAHLHLSSPSEATIHCILMLIMADCICHVVGQLNQQMLLDNTKSDPRSICMRYGKLCAVN